MEGRRVSRRKPRRNPLYVLFMGLLALSLVLLITVVVLGFKLKSARSDLAAAQTKIEQLRGGSQTGEDGQTVTGEDGSITGENDVSEPTQGDNMSGDNQTGGDTIDWLDLTGHDEVSVKPSTVYDKYYIYYTTGGVNLRSGPGTCYIWNIVYVKELIHDLKKVLPQVRIWMGGPEASYDAVHLMDELPEVELIMQGEGEETFTRLVEACERGTEVCFSEIPGIVLRCSDDTVEVHRPAPLMNLDDIPFSYGDLSGLEHRIIYYESSRGCPFSCSYCLSSIDKKVRFRSLSLVTRELQFFLDRKVPQVKFVDRTFNCKKSHSMAIWQYLLDHDNGITNFHFEISSDLLDDDELALMKQMRPGLIQLEIGVQTTNLVVVKEIRRTMDLDKVARRVAQVNTFGNIHQHLDLIAGLPYEDIESFHRSFNDVYKMEPEQLQLGFLKVLKGSYMEEMKQKYGLLSQSKPPYEVLRTNWLSYEEVIRLKGVEEMVEVYYNSGQFRRTMKCLSQEWGDAFDLYDRLAAFYEEEGLNGVSHNRLARYEILYLFIQKWGNKEISYQDLLIYDLYLRENVKSRPSFAPDPSEWKNETKQFFIREAKERRYLKGYEAYDSRQMAKMAHLEQMEDGSFVLFDYKNRDALFGNAAAFSISQDEI